MTKPIVLYNQNHERVGETYPRRAKQLIRNGRATWLEEGQILLINANHEPYPPEQEEPIMTTYQNNGTTVPPPPETHEMSDDLLLYLAKKNVAEKRSLVRHAIAYALALVILFTTSAVHHTSDMQFHWEPSAHSAPLVMDLEMPAGAQRAFPYINMDTMRLPNGMELRTYLESMPDVQWLEDLLTLERYILNSIATEVYLRTPRRHEGLTATFVEPQNIFTDVGTISTIASSGVRTSGARPHESMTMFFAGVMVAWGLWIVVRATKVWRRHAKRARVPAVNAVELEYQRLQSEAGSMY